MNSCNRLEALLGAKHPYLGEIERMRKFVLAVPFEKFYEPVSVIQGIRKKRKLTNLTPEMVNAWIQHVYCASRVRMLTLEEGALGELGAERLLTSMALIRSHVEAAGMACLCHHELRQWAETGDSSSVEELIPPTFLGTSMVRAQKKAESLEGTLLLSEQDKIPIGRMVSALDDFISCGELEGRAHSLYGFLCEYTHPNMRAVRDHIVTEDHEAEGWFHCYRVQAELTEEHFVMALRALMSSMKAGHAACEMLRRTEAGFDGTRGFLQFPDDDDVKEIWELFLNWPEGLS